MPLVETTLSHTVPEKKVKEIAYGLSGIVAKITGKPEKYVMSTIGTKEIMMSGNDESAALVNIKSIGGLTSTVCTALSAAICEYLTGAIEISPERVYITMSEVPAHQWGWNGSTFS